LTIEPIIAQNCYTCHGILEPSSGIPLEGYANLKAKVDDERLIGAIRHQSGYSYMPKDAPALSECNILKIEKWVAEGAQDN
jgi:mono/diheme cytochrome c family protein